MNPHKEGLEIFYLTLLLFGVLGNMFLLYLHSLKFITAHRKRPINLIIINLALAHVLMIIFRGITIIINVWAWKSFLDDMIGKILTYLIRVTRCISLCHTSFLSVFQAVTISPNSQMWTEIKIRASKYVVQNMFPLLCWIFNILIDVIVAVNISDPRNSSNERWRIGHSSFEWHDKNTIKILTWKSVVDALFMGLMICSSVYMVSVLYKHKELVQHIHSMSLSPRASHESRATKAILMMVGSFVCFNSASSPFVIYMASSNASRHWGLRFTILLSLFYPIVSPFMLIGIDTQIPRSLDVFLGLRRFCQKELSFDENFWGELEKMGTRWIRPSTPFLSRLHGRFLSIGLSLH
ncbi:vomeronasal type-1 receptor 3-like [Vombatus ursinus]|uniref:vomeronasal type-1 receptor 3-like n=1 Tax=Vombatus ursinus TaxID=29139 RepID=UPI000FFCE85B|nr:vomeronasal type-1 receptor 3-like [Vombatus ursinus]